MSIIVLIVNQRFHLKSLCGTTPDMHFIVALNMKESKNYIQVIKPKRLCYSVSVGPNVCQTVGCKNQTSKKQTSCKSFSPFENDLDKTTSSCTLNI